MHQNSNEKPFDLEQRTRDFAMRVRRFIKNEKKSILNMDDFRQMIRSSGSIGANYIEGNESLSKKDMLMRLRISRKEAKETRYWLLLVKDNIENDTEREQLATEAKEILMILSAIINKVEGK